MVDDFRLYSLQNGWDFDIQSRGDVHIAFADSCGFDYGVNWRFGWRVCGRGRLQFWKGSKKPEFGIKFNDDCF